MADLSLRAESVPATPHFPSAYPLDPPITDAQRRAADWAERLAALPSPPPALDHLIAALDAFDGDADLEPFDPDLEDAEGIGHDPYANIRETFAPGHMHFAMPGDNADDFHNS
jgi:hypothetical protein